MRACVRTVPFIARSGNLRLLKGSNRKSMIEAEDGRTNFRGGMNIVLSVNRYCQLFLEYLVQEE